MILSSRQRVVEAANAKLKQGQPVYVAWFGWCPPLFNNRMRAFHCSDICFWFKNTDRMFTHTGEVRYLVRCQIRCLALC